MRFKHPMPWEVRVGLFLFGVLGLALGAVVLLVVAVVLWAVVTS